MKVIVFIVVLISATLVNAQVQPPATAGGTDKLDEPKVCISQAAANQCAANTRERDALLEQVKALEASVAARDITITELKETNRKNVEDLTGRLTATEIKLAQTAGELVEARANINRVLMMNEFLLKNGRNKCGGLTIFCIQ